MKHDLDLSSELRVLRGELDQSFREEDWAGMSQVLLTVAQVGELQGQRELCLRAQTLRQVLDGRASGDHAPELFQQLMRHLTHFQWVCQQSR